MCGIYGAVTTQGVSITRNLLPHRGPDGWGTTRRVAAGKVIDLFHSRLAIIGLGEQGAQPFEDEAGNALIFNGEIYNFAQIRRELERDTGARFTTDTDTEVLFQSLLHRGTEWTCKAARGMFAFAWFERESEELWLARDHTGIKPLYLYRGAGSLGFASEAKALFETGLVQPRLRRELLGEYFANGWIHDPDTLFEDVSLVRAGTCVRVSTETLGTDEIQYWAYDNEYVGPALDLDDIIAEQTVSDVPIGLYLSGGIDSSILAHSLRAHEDLACITLDLGGGEATRVETLESTYRLSVSRLAPDDEDHSLLVRMAYHLDEPIADPAVIPAYRLARHARSLGRVVMLSGMGGDEIDAGYSRHRYLPGNRALPLLRTIPRWVLERALPARLHRDTLRLWEFAQSPSPSRYFNLIGYLSEREISELTQQPWVDRYEERISRLTKAMSGCHGFHALEQAGFLTSHNLLYMDKTSMAAGVEVRVPLLDHRLIQSFFPDICQSTGKKRLKAELQRRLGPHFSNVPKAGFTNPMRPILERHVRWSDRLEQIASMGLDSRLARVWVRSYSQGSALHEMKLWALLSLCLWHDSFF